MKRFFLTSPILLAVSYLFFGIFWIILTDQLLVALIVDANTLSNWQTLKGWVFVVGSTLLLFHLLTISARQYSVTQQVLQRQEQEYRFLFENNPLPMWLYDEATLTFLAVNEAAIEHYGYTRAEFLRMTLKDIRPAADIPRLLADVAATTRSLNNAGEWRHMRRDGTVFPVEIVSHSLEYKHRKARLVVVHDLTEQKRSQIELQASEERFRLLAENAPDFIYRYRLLPTAGYEYVCPAAAAMTGYAPDEFYEDAGLDYKLVHPEDRYLLDKIRQGDAAHDTAEVLRWVRKDGVTIWVEQRTVLILDEEDGRLTAVEGIARDVTEKVLTRQALQTSEARFRTAVEQAPFPIIIHAEDGEILVINQTWAEFTGYDLADLKTIPDWTERAYGERQAPIEEGIDRLYALNRRVSEGEFTITCQDGSQRIWDFSTSPLGRLPDGRRTVISMAVDVTDKKLAESNLQAVAAELNGYFINSLDLLCITDAAGNFRRLNKQWEELLGYPLDDMIGRPFMQYVHPEDKGKTETAVADLLNHGQVVNFVNRYRHREGSYRWIEWRASQIGEITYAAARDITDRIQNEQQLRLQSTALEAAANAIVIFDVDARIEWVNPAFTAVTGFTRQEALGQLLYTLLPSDTHTQPFYETLSQTLTTLQSWHGEIVNQRKDGASYIEETSITPVRDDSGQIVHFVAIKQDVTQRRKEESEREHLLSQVRMQAEQMSQIMQSVPEGILLLNGQNRLLLANSQGEEYLALLGGEGIGDVLTHLGALSLEALQTSPLSGSGHEVAADDGRVFIAAARPIEKYTPITEGWVLVLREVTRERFVQQQLQQQEKLAAIGQLAAGIAHDFNNILAVIVLYAELLQKASYPSADTLPRLTTIIEQANRAAALIQQILDFSRQSVMERRPLDLLPLLAEQFQLLQRMLPEYIDVHFQAEPGQFIVQADPTRMQQSIMNLAVNARDAMATGGKLFFDLSRLTVLNAKNSPVPNMAAGNWVRITIRDTGHGISQDILSHIFDPFFTTKKQGEGTGLGLAQVHGIIAQHDGHITVDSEADVGTTFTIYLPALEIPVEQRIMKSNVELPRGDGELILIVEDQEALREVISQNLEMWQYRTLRASNGVEALAQLEAQQEPVALILSDVIMPRMGGIALLQNLAQRNQHIPVVLMSGHPLDVDMTLLEDLGVFAVLKKPVQLEHLVHTAAAVLGKY